MALPCKGIAGQRHSMDLIAVAGRPVHVDSGRPQLSQSEQEGVAIIPALQRVPHQANRAVGFRPLGQAHGRSGQTAAGPHLHEHPVGVAEQCLNFIGEPYGGADVLGPAIGIGGLLVGHPRAGYVGQHRDSGRVQRHGGQVFGERGQDRIHRPRMKSVRGSDTAGHDALSGKAIGERPDRLLGACHHAAAGFVDGGEVD